MTAYLAILIGLAPALTQPAQVSLDSLRVRADRLAYDQASGLTHAQGHVLIETPSAWLTADSATFDEPRQIAQAEGHVTLSAPMRHLEGSRCVYDFGSMKGAMDDVEGWDESTGVRLFISGSRLEFEEGQWTLYDAHVRSSWREDPSYQAWAKELRYVEGHSWYATDLRGKVFGVEVIKTSEFEQRVTDFGITGLEWVPVPGSSEQDGVFLQWLVQRDLAWGFVGKAEARLGTRSGMSARGTLSRGLGDAIDLWGVGAWNELVGGQLRPFLRWDRIEGGGSWRITSSDGPWRVDAFASYGWFRERPTLARSTRTTAGIRARSRVYDWGDNTEVYADAGLQGFYYGTHNRYAYGWVGGHFSHRFGRDWRMWGGVTKHLIRGTPALETDRVIIPTELRLGARLKLTDRIAAEGEVRYDLDQGAVRYTLMGLRYRSADFVYRLRYNVETRFLQFDLLLPD